MNSKIKVRIMGKNFEIPDVWKDCYIFIMEGHRESYKGHDVAVSQLQPEWSEEKHVWVPCIPYKIVGNIQRHPSELAIYRSLKRVSDAEFRYRAWAHLSDPTPEDKGSLNVQLAGKTFEVPKEFQDGFIFMRTIHLTVGAVVMVSNGTPEWSTEWGWTPFQRSLVIGVIKEPVPKNEVYDSLRGVRGITVDTNNSTDKPVVDAVSKGMETLLPVASKMWWNKGSKNKPTQTPVEELRVYTWGNGKHKYMRINGIKYEVIGGSLVEVDVKCFLYPHEENHSGFRYLSYL